MSNIQIIQDPEEFRSKILQDFKQEIENLKQNFQPKKPTEYLTRKEVAEMLQINLSTLWNWTNSQKLKAYSIGNRVYYKRAEVENMIKPLNSTDND